MHHHPRLEPGRCGAAAHRAWRPGAWLAALLLLAQGLWVQGARAQEAGIDISSGTTQVVNGVWYLSARIDYRLNRDLLEVLQSGIPISFELQVELARERNWMPDAGVAELRQEYELSWQPLSRGYLVRNLNSGDQRPHATLYSALIDLGTISDLPLIDAALLDEGERYEVALRAGLNQQRLPGPLRLLAFWNDDFTLESDWYRWPLVAR